MKGMMERVKQLAERARRALPGRVAMKAMEDNVPSQAVLIAWNGLQTIFPIVLALVAILGAVLGSVGVRSAQIYQLVATAIPPEHRGEVVSALAGVRTRTGLFAILALVGFLWSASNLFGAMEQAFAVIFHVPR